MKQILIFLFLGMQLVIPVMGQNNVSNKILCAMRDELKRNKENLVLPGCQRPYYIAYTLERTSQFQIKAVLGAIVQSFAFLPESVGAIQLYVGDYNNNNNIKYLFEAAKIPLSGEGDYNNIRRGFWLGTDGMYKYALQTKANKDAFLQQQPLPEDEKKLADQIKVQAIKKMVATIDTTPIDLAKWERLMSELSAILKDYNQIYNSSATLQGKCSVIYKTTTEQVELENPMNMVMLTVQGYVLTDDGCRIDDSYDLLVPTLSDLPSEEELKKAVRDFADGLMTLRNAPVMDDYYNGPVLFEGKAVASLLISKLIKRGALIAYRKPLGENRTMITLENRLNKKIIDNRFSVVNYSDKKEYNSKPLYGAYEVDAEGVVPPKEQILVERGVFKSMLNGCIPTVYAQKSTGSSRFTVNGGGAYITAPGTLHIKVEDGVKADKLKTALQKAAKAAKSEYGYIVCSMNGKASRVYRVNAKNGKEELVRFANVEDITLSNLENVLGVSNTECVMNDLINGQTFGSLIYPDALLIDNVEITKRQVNKAEAFILPYPLQRQ